MWWLYFYSLNNKFIYWIKVNVFDSNVDKLSLSVIVRQASSTLNHTHTLFEGDVDWNVCLLFMLNKIDAEKFVILNLHTVISSGCVAESYFSGKMKLFVPWHSKNVWYYR